MSDYGNRNLIARTWNVNHQQAAQIASIAAKRGVKHSVLVRFLLDYALRAVADGRLQLRTRPSAWELIDDD